MISVLALVLSAAGAPATERVSATAEVRIVILQPHRASPESWEPARKPHQREIVKREVEGTVVKLRLTEFE